MNRYVITKTYDEPPVNMKEILRYARCDEETEQVSSLVRSCLDEVLPKLTYKVCYGEFPLEIKDGLCDFGDFSVSSEKLALNLDRCDRAVIFSGTIGVDIDRIISKYAHLSPSKAVVVQAIGAERIEALCNTFCKDYAKENRVSLKPRFSPGFGDLSLDFQKEIFSVLGCADRIGVTLRDSMIMSPSKSVTAIVGIKKEV
jgi:hypothetical protein